MTITSEYADGIKADIRRNAIWYALGYSAYQVAVGRKVIGMTARYAMALVAAAVMLAPQANAGDRIEADPIRQAAEQYGQGICSALHVKPVKAALADADAKLTTAGFTEQEAGAVVAYSLVMFCRDEISAVRNFVKQ